MSSSNRYVLDQEAVRVNAYRLLCIFFANKEIARRSDPSDPQAALAQLERRFFHREMTHLLLGIAIGIRVLDDQMSALPATNALRARYEANRKLVDRRHQCMMFEEMSLRQVCNKIIHANIVEPHSVVSTSSHMIDEYNSLAQSDAGDAEELGDEVLPELIEWQHLTGNIRLGGSDRGSKWWQLLQVPTFVEAVFELLETELDVSAATPSR